MYAEQTSRIHKGQSGGVGGGADRGAGGVFVCDVRAFSSL